MITEEAVHRIPKYLMSYKKSPEEMLLRFKWVGSDMIKIINREGQEKLIYTGTDEFEQLAFNQIQDFDVESEKYRHFYFNRAPLRIENVTERLMRKCQSYKSAQVFDPVEQPNYEINMYEHMFTIDFEASAQITKKFASDLSFSYITWRNIEQLEQEEISIHDLDDETIKQISFTILPQGRTVLHELYNLPDAIESIFQKALEDLDDIRSLKYSIPYLSDLQDDCPIVLCLQNEQLKTVTTLLRFLSGQGIDHHSKSLARCLPQLLELNIATFVEYMESRSQETAQTKEFSRREVDKSHATPGIMATDIWT